MSAADLAKALLSGIGDNAAEQVVTQWIDTGYPPLNKILSGSNEGGLPFGRMIEMYGESSTGKCLTGETMLLSEKGMTTIAELYEIEGYIASCVQKSVEHSVALVNERGELEQTSHLVWNGRRPFKRIELKSGGRIEATFRHPIRVLNNRGEVVWRFAEDIQVGDYIPTMRGTMQFGNGSLTVDEAKMIGYLVADGSCSVLNKISLSNSDAEVEAEFKRIAKNIFSKDVTTYSKSDSMTRDHTIHSKEVREALATKYGIDYQKSADKQVPLTVRTAGKEAQLSFLRSYFELECHVDPGLGIEVTSASKRLLDQVRLMLLNIGITSTISEKMIEGYSNPYYRLFFSGANYDLYINTVGFETTARRASCLPRSSKIERTYANVVPNINAAVLALYDSLSVTDRETNLLVTSARHSGGLTYELLEKIVESLSSQRTVFNNHLFSLIESHLATRFFFDKVSSISDDDAPTFDVVLPKTHSFWTNGIISHNTALATQWMVQAQKMGGVAGFIDWERSFNVDLAKNLGLNAERPYWLYYKPKTWEEGNMIAAKAAKIVRESKEISDDAPILFVFDSIAAAMPKSVSEKELDELSMNDTTALARVTSTTLKSMAHFCEETNATFLYLNQIRLKPGVMYGSPLTTPGGKAMEFYASGRLSLGRQKVMEEREVNGKKEKTFVGQAISIQCTKSKFTKPFNECSLRMSFDDAGIASFDMVYSLLEFLIDNKLLAYSKPRVTWLDGKQYFVKALAQKINDEKGYGELVKLLGV